MFKEKIRLLSRIIIACLVLIGIMYLFPTRVLARSFNEYEKDLKISSCKFHPIIEKFSYDLDEIIQVSYVLKADSQIENVSSICDGFEDAKNPYINLGHIDVSIMVTDRTDDIKYTLVVELYNGAKLQSSIYGIIENNKVYINSNSFFAARDIYWAEVLSKRANDKNEEKIRLDYDLYLRKVNAGAIRETKYITERKEQNNIKSGTDTTVSGLIQWYDDWSRPHPLQFAKLEVMDEGGGIFGWYDISLGIIYTDEYGHYSFDFSNRNGGRNIYIKIYPGGENSIVKTGTGNDYVLRTLTDYGVTTGSSIVRNQDIINEYEITQVFEISQAINVSSRFVKEISGITMPNVIIKYPHNESNTDCYYRSNDSTIFMVGNTRDDFIDSSGHILHSYASWDVIQHEYFHHVQHYFNIINSCGGWHDGGNMYDHYMSHYIEGENPQCIEEGIITCTNPTPANAKEYAISLVYSEAWASIMGGIAQQYAIANLNLDDNIGTVGDSEYHSYNWAHIEYENGEVGGEATENSICGILWDLYDDDNYEYFDEISLGATDFWDLSINSGAKTLSELINYYNDVYSSLNSFSKLGGLLSHYRVGASGLNYSTNSVNLPIFSWTANGLSDNLQNDYFDVIFYNIYKAEILRINTSSTSITLTQEQWDTILYSLGDKFYISVLTYQTSNPVTGGYYSNFIECSKPEVEDIVSTIYISANNRYQEQMFKLRQNQSIYYYVTFETAGNRSIQTFGRKDTILYLYSSSENLLDSNDDAGYFLNALINYNFVSGVEYIIKVKFLSENEAGSVKIGMLPTDNIYGSYEQIPCLQLENGVVSEGQRVSVNQNSVYMYTIKTADSGNYHITTTQENGCNITDTYLYFIDPDLTTSCEYDDDSGDGYNASLDVYLEANKRYLIIVSPYNITTTSGDIWLTIQTN